MRCVHDGRTEEGGCVCVHCLCSTAVRPRGSKCGGRNPKGFLGTFHIFVHFPTGSPWAIVGHSSHSQVNVKLGSCSTEVYGTSAMPQVVFNYVGRGHELGGADG